MEEEEKPITSGVQRILETQKAEGEFQKEPPPLVVHSHSLASVSYLFCPARSSHLTDDN